MDNNNKAFLDMIAHAELGALLQSRGNGYNVIVGSRPGRVIKLRDYSDHPRIVVQLRKGLWSSAAGRYQILQRTYDAYKKRLQLPDFSPESQDRIALQLIKEQGALPDITAGKIVEAVDKVKNIWASLPGAGYGQHEHRVARLVKIYKNAGGVVA